MLTAQPDSLGIGDPAEGFFFQFEMIEVHRGPLLLPGPCRTAPEFMPRPFLTWASFYTKLG
jgi:hypothetical protein